MGKNIHRYSPPQGNFIHRDRKAHVREARSRGNRVSKALQSVQKEVRFLPVDEVLAPLPNLDPVRVVRRQPSSPLKYTLFMLLMLSPHLLTMARAESPFNDFHEHENRVGFGYEWGINPLDVEALYSDDKHIVPTVESTNYLDQSLFVTKDGLETTKIRHEMILQAKQSIEISGNFGGGEVFLETMETLDESLRNNKELKVHLIFSNDFIEEADQKALDRLKERYGDRLHYQLTARKFLDASYTNIENHVKMTVVDGKYIIIGGTGITDNFVTKGDVPPPEKEMKSWAEMVIPKGARDADFIAIGDVAKKGRAEFFKLLKKWERMMQENQPAPLRWFPLDEKNVAQVKLPDHETRVEEGVSAQLVTCGPEQGNNQCTQAILKKMLSADRALYISHMYQNYVPQIHSAMDLLRKRDDLDLRVITNKWWGNSPIRNVIMYSTFKILPQMNLRYYDVDNILYHKKIMIIQGKNETCIMNGSYNLGQKSDGRDDEVVLIACKHLNATGPAFDQTIKSFNDDWSLSVHDTGTFLERFARGFVVNVIKALQGGTEFLGSRTV